MKDLKTIKENLQQSNVQRTQASITSPCLSVDNQTSNGNTNNVSDTNTKTQDNHNIKTVDDAAQEIIKRLFK
jgi:hypothetical protein